MIRITVPASLRYRDVVIRAVAATCRLIRAAGAGPTDRADESLDLADPFDAAVVSAFAELLNNICLHGHDGGPPGDIEIELEPRSGELAARITEHGQPFELDTVPEPDLAALPEGGMGIHICRQLLDFIGYQPGPPNVWTLKKRYRQPLTRPTAAADE